MRCSSRSSFLQRIRDIGAVLPSSWITYTLAISANLPPSYTPRGSQAPQEPSREARRSASVRGPKCRGRRSQAAVPSDAPGDAFTDRAHFVSCHGTGGLSKDPKPGRDRLALERAPPGCCNIAGFRRRQFFLPDIALIELDGHLAHRPPLERTLGFHEAIELIW